VGLRTIRLISMYLWTLISWTSRAFGRLCRASCKRSVHCCICALTSCSARAAVPVYDVEVVHTYPHRSCRVHRGAVLLERFLYESTGLEQHSSIRKCASIPGRWCRSSTSRHSISAKGSSTGRASGSLTWQSHVDSCSTWHFNCTAVRLSREGWRSRRMAGRSS